MRRVVVTLPAALLVVAGGAAYAQTTTPTALVPSGSHAASYDTLTAMAGSADYLAYTRSNSAPGGGTDSNTSTLWIRNDDGSTYQLSPVAHVPEPYGVSLTGSILVVGGLGQADAWYDLATGTHGTPTPAPGSTAGYVAAASNDGWLTLSEDQHGGDEVFDTTTSGAVTSYGVPFPGNKSQLTLVPGPLGVLAAAYPDIAYMKYSSPGTWTPLTAVSDGNVICTDVSTTDAACVLYVSPGGEDGEPFPKSILQVPLNGSPVIKTTPDCAGSQAELSSTAIVWLCDSSPTQDAEAHVHSVPLGGGPVSESSIAVPLGAQLESAHGTVDFPLNPTSGPATMYGVTGADEPFDPLFVTSHSTVEAAQLAVTTGRVVWQDDRSSLLPVSARPIGRTSTGQIEVGPESDLFNAAYRFALAASGARTVVQTQAKAIIEASPLGLVRVPISGMLSSAFAAEQPLSGNRYLYATIGPDSQYEYVIRDLGTGKDHVLRTPHSARLVSAAIWGNEAAFIDHRGRVWWRNLATGKTHRLQAPLPDSRYLVGLVSVYDNVVGWDTLWRSDDGRPNIRAHYRNIATMAPATALPARDVITQVSSDGLVVQRFPDPSHIDLFGGGYTTATWQLMPYDGTDRQQIATYPAATQVTVDNGVIAYLDANQQPQTLPVAHPTSTAPISLGDPVAPTTFTDTSTNRWTTFQAFSRPLTSCAITIRRSGTEVARLRCDPNAMNTGDAYAQWNGRNRSDQRVKPGRYTWRITAKNEIGHVTNPDGNALHGAIRVGHSQ